MDEQVQKALDQFSFQDLEKLKRLLSIMPDASQEVNMAKPMEVVTLRVFSDEYSHYIKLNLSKAYHSSVVLSLRHFSNYFGLQKPIQSIGLRDIEGFVSYLQLEVPKGYRVYVKTLKAAFNKAIDWEYVKENYFLKIKLPKKQQVHPAYINDGQLAEICEKIENEDIKEMVIVAFYTGMRLNELVNLDWRNVNLSTRLITVGGNDFTTKTRGQRVVPISDEVYKIFQKRYVETGKINNLKNEYIFSKSDGRKYSSDHVSKTFKRACTQAEIDPAIHYHSLRHSTASSLVQKGVSIYVVRDLLGHSSITTTEIYSHLNTDSLKNAIRKFDEK